MIKGNSPMSNCNSSKCRPAILPKLLSMKETTQQLMKHIHCIWRNNML